MWGKDLFLAIHSGIRIGHRYSAYWTHYRRGEQQRSLKIIDNSNFKLQAVESDHGCLNIIWFVVDQSLDCNASDSCDGCKVKYPDSISKRDIFWHLNKTYLYWNYQNLSQNLITNPSEMFYDDDPFNEVENDKIVCPYIFCDKLS
jgi:hypothetical protein